MKFEYQDFKIFFTFLLLWISIQFGQIIEDSVAYGMILSIGIIHGANDLLILKKEKRDSGKFKKSVFGYLTLILLCVLSFLISPFLSICLFILMSAYHFGEEHWEEKISGSQLLKFFVYLSYGILIFSLIFIENIEDVHRILGDLTGSIFSEALILISLVTSSFLLIFLLCITYFRKNKLSINWIRELFYLLVLYLLFKTSSLMLGFGVYFIFWHSIPSIIHQTKFLYGNSRKVDLLNYFKTAGVFWIISILGIFSIYYFVNIELFNSIIFLILFAVTAPHIWVMYSMKNTSLDS